VTRPHALGIDAVVEQQLHPAAEPVVRGGDQMILEHLLRGRVRRRRQTVPAAAAPGAEPELEWRFAWDKSDGAEMEMRGVYKEITPPERLVNTESWGGDWPETLNTLILSEQDGKTTITQTVVYPSKDAREAALQTGMQDGVNLSFNRLAAYLRTIG
jgi:uncharacterized protein YndB with AHSA1/START domain